MSQFKLIRADDWEVLFKDGKVIQEHHTIIDGLDDALDLIEKYGITKENFSSREATKKEYQYLNDFGSWGDAKEEEINAE